MNDPKYLVVEEDDAILGRGNQGNAGVRGRRLIAFELDDDFLRAYREGRP